MRLLCGQKTVKERNTPMHGIPYMKEHQYSFQRLLNQHWAINKCMEFHCSYLSRLHTDLLWWVFYDPLLSTLVSLYRGPLASPWHPIQQATKQLIRAPLGGSPWKALIWYFQGIPEPQQCIHTAPMHAWLGSLLWPFIVHGAQQRIRITEGEPTCLLSCGKSQKPDANGKLMGLKHCTLPERGNCWLIETTWMKTLSWSSKTFPGNKYNTGMWSLRNIFLLLQQCIHNGATSLAIF